MDELLRLLRQTAPRELAQDVRRPELVLPPDVVALLEVVRRHRVEDHVFGEGDDVDAEWAVFPAGDHVVPRTERPFEHVVADAARFTSVFGMLQWLVPMVPLLKLGRRDQVYVVGEPPYPLVVLPQESLFDWAAPELDGVSEPLPEAVATLRTGGTDAFMDLLVEDGAAAALARYRTALPFLYLLHGEDGPADLLSADGLGTYVLNELLEIAALPVDPAAAYRGAPAGVFEAFVALSHSYFAGDDAACGAVAAGCVGHPSPLVRDMGRAYGAVLAGRAELAGVPVAAMRAVTVGCF